MRLFRDAQRPTLRPLSASTASSNRHPVPQASEAVESRLAALNREALSSQAALQARVVALEGEISRLKALK